MHHSLITQGTKIQSKSKELLNSLNVMPFPIVAVDCQQIIREYNEKARELFGKIIEGKQINDFLDNLNLSQRVFNTLMSKKENMTILNFRGCTFRVIISPLMIGGITERVLICLISVSKIYATLIRMRRAKEYFEAIVGSFSGGIAVINKRKHFMYVNPLFTEILHLPLNHILGRSIDDLYDQGILLYPSIIEEAFLRKSIVEGNDRIYDGEELHINAVPSFSKQGCLEKVIIFAKKKRGNTQVSSKLSLPEAKAKRKPDSHKAQHIISRNKKIISILETIKRVAPTTVPILLCGETGVGKGLFAKNIHMLSGRTGTFVKINCNALPGELVESELFGYEAGAFTGAGKKGKIGLFEVAEGGTLFLDEIGDMPISVQGKLLDFLDDQKIRRVGGTSDIYVNVGLVAASNKDLGKLVEEGKFRPDLYYRLNVLRISIPPLRTRKEDIPILIGYYLSKFNKRYGYSTRFTNAALERLTAYHWPGNIRELVNLVENMVITAQGETIKISNLPQQVKVLSFKGPLKSRSGSLRGFVEKLEKDLLRKALKERKSSREIAELLGTSHTTVLKKIKRYGLSHYGS